MSMDASQLLKIYTLFKGVIFLMLGKMAPLQCKSYRKDKELGNNFLIFCKYLNLVKNQVFFVFFVFFLRANRIIITTIKYHPIKNKINVVLINCMKRGNFVD
jgi:hypothetical protein